MRWDSAGYWTATAGDVYRVEVRDADGAVVLSDEETPTYVESTPNGPGCAPVCHWAEVDRRAGRDAGVDH